MKTPEQIAKEVQDSLPLTATERAAMIAAIEADRAQREQVTREQYSALCDVIDRAKMDDCSLDTMEYAADAMSALGVKYP